MRVTDILGPLCEAGKCLITPSTLYRWISKYKNTNPLALERNDGTRMGRPLYVAKSKLPILNERVLENSGKVDTVTYLSNGIMALHNREN